MRRRFVGVFLLLTKYPHMLQSGHLLIIDSRLLMVLLMNWD